MAPRKKRSRHKHPAVVQSCQSQTASKYFRLITIDTLSDDILLEVFDQYRLLSAGDWSHLQGWYKLAHTCQRWRLLVFTSSLRLHLQLRCTFRTPVVDMLNHFPFYPLVLDYGPRILKTWTTEDQHDLLFALRHLSRAKEIMLSAPQSILAEMTAAMVEAAPRLEHLTLHSQSTEFILPRSFLNGDAPQLRHLILTSASLATLGPLLSSTSLVSLVLERVPSPAYFSPTSLVAHIRSMPHLQKLAIGFLSTVPRPGFRGEPFLPRGQMDRVTLPALAQLVYRGVSAYIEALLARVETPLLQDVDLTLFNQLTLRIPHTCAFFRDLEMDWPARACIDFTETSAYLRVSALRLIEPPDISLAVSCPRLDFQVSAMVQICSGLSDTGVSAADVGTGSLPLSIEELTLGFHQNSLPEEWRDEVDPALWRALLIPFRRVRTLRLHTALAIDFERALRPDRPEAAADADADVGGPTLVTVGEELKQELILPELSTVVLLRDNAILPASALKALHAFIKARDHVGRPITVKYRNPTNGKPLAFSIP